MTDRKPKAAPKAIDPPKAEPSAKVANKEASTASGTAPNTGPIGGYVVFRKLPDTPIRGRVDVTPSRKRMLSWIETYDAAEPPHRPEDPEDPEGAGRSDDLENEGRESLAHFMLRARESLTSFHPMIAATSILMPSLRAHFIHDKMYRPAKARHEHIQPSPNYEAFAIKPNDFEEINRQVRRLKELDRGMELMPGAVLMSMVATFDYLLSDLVRVLIRYKPERIENSARSMSVKEILLMENFSDVRNKVIDDEIDNLMRSSHEDQVSYIETNFGIKIRSSYDRWSDFMEIFERRNLAAHGNLVVNRIYITNCAEHGCNVSSITKGDSLDLSAEYLRNSADTLLEFILLSVLVLWKKTIPEESEIATQTFGDEIYELIRDGRNSVSARLLDFVLNKQKFTAADANRRVMIINHAIALMKDGKEDQGILILDDTDWSASSDDFKMCNAAIRGDIKTVIDLMPIAAQGKKIELQNIREWPAFDWVRDDEQFAQTVKDVFGEDLNTEVSLDGPNLALDLSKLM